ncbi:MAG: hypothetical protein H6851_11495 [Geminicoccaceae bacterium]|nr:YeeE/YedE family protein [Geminicoccaceae bacterium]MCB9944226.1 hypothetical protein [Geminicoccaceae bacterium]
MKNLAAFISGGLFGLGLVVSDMVNPQRVQGFFDIFGAWDPTLVFVIVGANIPMMLSWWWVRRHERSVLGENLPARPSLTIDRRLIGGAVVFGAGWGLVGLCPGTAVASVLFGLPRVLVFVGAMFTGFVAYHHWQVRRRTVVA